MGHSHFSVPIFIRESVKILVENTWMHHAPLYISEIKNTTKPTLGNMTGTVTRHYLRHYVYKM